MSQAELRTALADDLDGLARLHDRELDASLVDVLVEFGFPDNFALLPDPALREAMRTAVHNLQKNARYAARGEGAMEPAESALPGAPDDYGALAADFAGIYLNGAFGASPYESVWLTDEHLTCQLPMFELRTLYQEAGLAVDDWRKRYDDHFVLQFQYLAHRLRDSRVALEDVGAFTDAHVGHWFAGFAKAVSSRADSDFYRALALLTADWLERFRALVEEVSGESRTPHEVMAERIRKKIALATGELAPVKFVPGGAGPSW